MAVTPKHVDVLLHVFLSIASQKTQTVYVAFPMTKGI